MRPKEQRVEFWHKFFLDHGFWLDHKYIQNDSSPMIWYSCGDFRIGYDSVDINESRPPRLDICYFKIQCSVVVTSEEGLGSTIEMPLVTSHGTQGLGIVEVPLISLKEFLFVVENMMFPEKLPLLVGIDWAKELASILLKGKA